MPVYKEGPNLYLVRVWHKGKAHSRRFHGTRRGALEDEAAFRLEVRAEPEASPPVPTLWRFLLDEYRPHAELRLRPTWRRNQAYTLATIAERLGDKPLTDIDATVIEAFMLERRDEDGLSEVTVNNDRRVLMRVLSFAVERGHLARVPKCPPLAEPEGRVRCWSHAELERLFNSTGRVSPALLPMLVFLANTGCRRGEAMALRWASVEIERRIVKIEPGNGWRPKNGRAREVPVNDALLPWLQVKRRGEYVFPCDTGTRYAGWPAAQYDRAQAGAGLSGGVHTLRHTYASHFLARRPDLALLAYVMGHSDATVTRLYAHMLPDHLERARDAVSFVAPAAAAEAVAVLRWREDRRKPSGRPSGEDDARAGGKRPTAGDLSERATGFEPATSSLGSVMGRSKILKLLKR